MDNTILNANNIKMNVTFRNKEEAIRKTGQLLVDGGYVTSDYVDKMIERENISTTFVGNFVAVPHGTGEAKQWVKNTGMSIIQVPEGVDFGNGNVAKILVGIAGKGNEHLEILSKLAVFFSEIENVEQIVNVKSAEEMLRVLGEVN